MKYLIIFLAIGAIGCAKGNSEIQSDQRSVGACAGSGLDKQWVSSDKSDNLTLYGNCEGYSTYCESTFTYEVPKDSQHPLVNVDIITSNGNYLCPATGKRICSILTSGNYSEMILNCGIDTYYLEK